MLTEQEMRQRLGPVLPDGTPLRSLIDFDKRRVGARVLNDQHIHELEMERIFATAWVTLGHEAEIPNAGDYVSRFIGEDNVIVVRGEEGGVHVWLNTCPHRASEVCSAEEGNTASFKCPYHGWVFAHDGRLLSAPFERDFYGDWPDKSECGLITARVETRHGIIFGTFGESAPTLDEYLGDIGWYFDYYLGDTEWELAGQSQRSSVPANWKTMSDQIAGDEYHTQTLHRGLFEALGMEEMFRTWRTSVTFNNIFVPPGHTILLTGAAGDLLKEMHAGAGNPDDAPGQSAASVAGNGHADQLAALQLFIMQIFPCSTFSCLMKGTMATVGGIIPKGPNRFEQWGVSVVAKGASEAVRASAMPARGPDLAGADDVHQFARMDRATRGVVARKRLTLKYNSFYDEPNNKDWPAPGLAYVGDPKDNNQWDWWRQWFDVMTNDG